MANEDDRHAKRASGTALLLEQVARRMFEKRHHQDLHAAQWSALRYFSRAGRQTATVIGLSRYLGNTSGSTSRTARSLVDRGLLVGTPSPHDARSVMFALTDEGRAMLDDDPLNDVATLFADLPAEDLGRLGDALDHLQTSMTKKRSADR